MVYKHLRMMFGVQHDSDDSRTHQMCNSHAHINTVWAPETDHLKFLQDGECETSEGEGGEGGACVRARVKAARAL